MLRYLNQVDFSPFGKITKDERYYGGEIRHISDTHISVFRQSNSYTYINIVSGLCALCIKSDNIVHTFLLDKPIILKPDIAFALSAVEDSCDVRIISDSNDFTDFPVERFIPIKRTPQIFINDIISFFYQECEFGLRTSVESHDFYELTYVDSGSITNVVDGKSYIAHQGEMMLFFPGQTHVQHCLPNKSSSFITVGFHMSLENSHLLKNKVFKTDSIVKGIFSNILSEYQIFDEYSTDMLAGYLIHIMLHIIRYNSGYINTPQFALEPNEAVTALKIKNNTTNRLVKNAIDYIDTHIEKKLSLDDVAKTLNINSAYMSRLFKEHAGLCITDYIRLQKLGKAKKLLKSGGYTVTEISEMFSFSSIHYFSNCFKKEFGISPADYANMLKN